MGNGSREYRPVSGKCIGLHENLINKSESEIQEIQDNIIII